MRPSPLLLSVGLLLWGCGPKYGQRVPDELLERLPYETRIELLEAENDLALAYDHLDEAHNEVSRTRDAIRRAKERRSAAKDEVGNATDAVSEEVARLAVEEADARVEYLRARQELNLRMVDLKELAVRCAHARFEQTRLAVARKAKVEGSETLDPNDFEAQVKACDAELAEDKGELNEPEAAIATAKQRWEQHKSALAKKTFDARASPYVE